MASSARKKHDDIYVKKQKSLGKKSVAFWVTEEERESILKLMEEIRAGEFDDILEQYRQELESEED